MNRYLRHFNRDRFFLTTYQSIKQSPRTTIQSICQLLGVSGDVDFSDALNGRTNEDVYSKPRLRLIQLTNPYRFEYFYDGQRLRHSEDIGLFGRVLIRLVRTLDRRFLEHVVTDERPSLDSEVKSELKAHYRPDAEKLRQGFDLDIEHWSVFSNDAQDKS
jgi:hypothetical protein